jgi:lysozyme
MEKTVPHWGKMNDHQKAAVISFSYNVGENFMKNKNFKTIQDALNNPEKWNTVPSAMAMYTKATNPKTGKKETLRGLVTRREMEGGLWSKPVN